MQKKLDLKHYLLIFIETFNIWQMGIIFYSSKTLTINNLINTPIVLNNSIFVVLLGYIIGILAMYFKPQKTILLGRISMLISLVYSVLLFLPINTVLFSILYYILTFNCVFFISINMSLIINYYSIKTALTDVILGAITSGFFIALCQNQILPLSFNVFNFISVICLSLIVFAFFKLPTNYNIKFTSKDNKVKLPSKKTIIGLAVIHFLASLNTLFTASISESVMNGTSVAYIGVISSALLFVFLYKKKKLLEFKICTYYFGITAIGFLLYLIPINEIKYLSLFLQGFGFFLLLITPYFATNLFETYPSKLIAPVAVSISLVAVFISSGILEILRNNSTLLYSIYSFISILATILYLLFEKDLEFNYSNKKTNFDKLTKRENDVANLLVKGYTVKEISQLLFLSEYTIKDYIKSIYRKYEVNSKVKFIVAFNNNNK